MNLSRNYLFIPDELQNTVLNTHLTFAGCGLGSVIAEVAARTGFVNMTLIDGDSIEDSNLNRQNFTATNINEPKVEALAKRLTAINPSLSLSLYNNFIQENNINNFDLDPSDILINTIDFDDETSSLFLSNQFLEKGKLVITPINLSFGNLSLVFTNEIIAKDDSYSRYREIVKKNQNVIADLIELAMEKESGKLDWFREYLNRYKQEYAGYNPQLGIGSFLVASQIVKLCLEYLKSKIEFNNRYKFFNSIRLL